MRNSALRIVLLITALLPVPVFSQAANPPANSSPSMPEPQPATATGRQPLQGTDRGFWEGDQPGIGSLLLHPFARKAYIKRKLQPIQDRVQELDQLTAANKRQIEDVDARAQQGLKMASAKANEANDHAQEATEKSEGAQQAATQANTKVNKLQGVFDSLDSYTIANQLEIRFRPGQSELSIAGKQALDRLAAPLKNGRGYVIEVHAFSAGRGQAAISSSRKVADAVVRYLVLNGEVPDYRIFELALGSASPVGTANGSNSRYRTGGWVEISVMKNGVDQLASGSTASGR